MAHARIALPLVAFLAVFPEPAFAVDAQLDGIAAPEFHFAILFDEPDGQMLEFVGAVDPVANPCGGPSTMGSVVGNLKISGAYDAGFDLGSYNYWTGFSQTELEILYVPPHLDPNYQNSFVVLSAISSGLTIFYKSRREPC